MHEIIRKIPLKISGIYCDLLTIDRHITRPPLKGFLSIFVHHGVGAVPTYLSVV